MNLHDITKKYILNDTELVIIETIINELSKGNQKISIRDIASQTYVSTTVIVKLAKKLGFVGYSQMLYVLNESIHQKVSIENLSDLSEFVNNDDIETVQKLIDYIYQHKHEKIYLVGVGFSDIITHYFLKRLASFDIFAYDGAPIDCINARSNPSIIILFSKSGETAEFIAQTNHDVTILEMKPAILTDMVVTNMIPNMERLHQQQIKIVTNATVSKINENAVSYKNADGDEITIPASTVVSAFGYKAYNPLENVAKENCNEVYVIGSAVKAGNALTAIQDGYQAGLKL